MSEAPPPLAGVDPRLAAWVGRMLEKRPEARPAGAVQAWAELEEVVVDLLGPYWRRDAALGENGEAAAAATTTAAPQVRTTQRRPEPTPVQPASRRRRRLPVAGAVLLLGLGGAAAVVGFDGEDPAPRATATPTPGPLAPAASPFDFDGDGVPSAVVGVADAGESGAVSLPGAGTIEAPRPRDGADFGAAVVSGDFDSDGKADLAVGAPEAAARGQSPEGVVYVFAGSNDELGDAAPDELPWPDDDKPRLAARFGAALAAGDLNGDTYDDIAVGAPGSDRSVREPERSGSVVVFLGGKDGLSETRRHRIPRPRGVAAGFGSVLAIGDVNRDKRLDLLEGAPGPAGHATYCRGGRRAPRRCRVMGDSLPGPQAIAVGDVTGDRYRDVVHGVPEAGSALILRSGAVRVWRGGQGGPTGEPITITQDLPEGVIGHDQPDDAFGTAVAVAKLDRDRFADIIVGTPGQDEATGRIAILYGDGDGVDEARDGGYSAETEGGIKLEPGSRYGTSIALLDVNGDGRRDLLVAAPGDGVVRPRFIRIAGRGRSFDFGSQATDSLPGQEARIGAP